MVEGCIEVMAVPCIDRFASWDLVSVIAHHGSLGGYCSDATAPCSEILIQPTLLSCFLKLHVYDKYVGPRRL